VSHPLLDYTWLERAYWGKGCFIEDYLLLSALVHLLKPRTLLEIGTSTGLGAVVLAQAARQHHAKAKVWTIDVDQRHGRDNVHLIPGIAEYIEFRQGASDDVLAEYRQKGQRFDLAFIDGDHSYAQACRDWRNVRRLTEFVILHDTTQFTGLQQLARTIEENGRYQVFQFVSAPGHRVKPKWTREGFCTGMTLVQSTDLLGWLPAQVHRDHNGDLLPGHPERKVPGLKVPWL